MKIFSLKNKSYSIFVLLIASLAASFASQEDNIDKIQNGVNEFSKAVEKYKKNNNIGGKERDIVDHHKKNSFNEIFPLPSFSNLERNTSQQALQQAWDESGDEINFSDPQTIDKSEPLSTSKGGTGISIYQKFYENRNEVDNSNLSDPATSNNEIDFTMIIESIKAQIYGLPEKKAIDAGLIYGNINYNISMDEFNEIMTENIAKDDRFGYKEEDNIGTVWWDKKAKKSKKKRNSKKKIKKNKNLNKQVQVINDNNPTLNKHKQAKDNHNSKENKYIPYKENINASPLNNNIILKGHTEYINSIALSQDNQFIVSASGDKTIRIWYSQTGKELPYSPLRGHTRSIDSVAISGDNQYIVSGSYKTIHIWDFNTGKEVHYSPLTGHTNWINSVAISYNNQYIISGSTDKTVRIWDLHTGAALAYSPLRGHKHYIQSVAISSNNQYIISGSQDKTIRIFDFNTGKKVNYSPLRTKGIVFSVAISNDNRYIVSGNKDKTIRIWNFKTGKLFKILKGHTKEVCSVAISWDSQYIVSSSWDNTIRIWHLNTGREIPCSPLTGHIGSVDSVAISNDNRYILSAGEKKIIIISDLKSLAYLHSKKKERKKKKSIINNKQQLSQQFTIIHKMDSDEDVYIEFSEKADMSRPENNPKSNSKKYNNDVLTTLLVFGVFAGYGYFFRFFLQPTIVKMLKYLDKKFKFEPHNYLFKDDEHKAIIVQWQDTKEKIFEVSSAFFCIYFAHCLKVDMRPKVFFDPIGSTDFLGRNVQKESVIVLMLVLFGIIVIIYQHKEKIPEIKSNISEKTKRIGGYRSYWS